MRSLTTLAAAAAMLSSALVAQAGQTCANPEAIAGSNVLTYGTNVGYPNTGDFTCGYMGSSTHYYSWTAPTSGAAVASFCTGGGTLITMSDSMIGVYQGTCGSLNEIGCNDDWCGLQSEVTFPVTAGQNYIIEVAGFAGDVGSYALYVGCAGALSVTQPFGPGSVQIANSCGTPFATYVTAITANQGNYPYGWFGGVDIGFPELLSEALSGSPIFVGNLDFQGNSLVVIPSGVPQGLTFYMATAVLQGPNNVPTFPFTAIIATT